MKKLISMLLVMALLVTALFTLTGCGKSGEEGDAETSVPSKDVAKYYENAETGELNDVWNGLSLKFAYPKDKGFELTYSDKKEVNQKVTMKSTDLNCKIELSFKNVAADEATKRVEKYSEDTEKYAEATEIEYAGYKGCSVNYTDWSGTKKFVLLMLGEADEGKWYGLDISIEKYSTFSTAAEFDAPEYYNSEEFQNLLNSIQYTKTEPVQVDGVLSQNRDLVVKKLTAPSDEYTVEQYPDTNGVMNAFMLTEGQYNGSGAYFRVYDETNIDTTKFATLDKVIEYYTGDTWKYTYTDEKLAGLDVKVEHKPSDTAPSEKYAVWEAGFFEKDGKVYNFLYYRYAEVPEEIGTKLIEEVVANMYEYTEN